MKCACGTHSTCHIELDLQGDLAGYAGVTQQLVGLLQRAVLGRDAVDGQDAVADLQDPTPEPTTGCNTVRHGPGAERAMAFLFLSKTSINSVLNPLERWLMRKYCT